MSESIQMLDGVALTEALSEPALPKGQVGTVVEALRPGVYEVEFADDAGHYYAIGAVRAEQLLVLHYEPAQAHETG